MLLVDQERFNQVRKKVSLQSSLLYGSIFGVLAFLFISMSGFVNGLIFGVFSGALLFGFLYFFRGITHKGSDRKKSKIQSNNPMIDVFLSGEMGLLEFSEHQVIYHSVTPGGAVKQFEHSINENVFVSLGNISYRRIQKYKYRDIQMGYLLLKEMPNGIPRQFEFYNIDGLLDKVEKLIQENYKIYQ